MSMSLNLLLLSVVCAPPIPRDVDGQVLAGFDDPAMIQALRIIERDPPIAEVQKAALEHFGVHGDTISGYRGAARLRALLPTLSGSVAKDSVGVWRGWTDRAQFPTGSDSDPQTTDTTQSNGLVLGGSASWDLGTLVFSSAQLETYALVGIQEDLLTEVTRLYYTRQHNLLTMALEPPRSPRAKAALLIRTREIEAMLDALTGGAFSKMKKTPKNSSARE